MRIIVISSLIVLSVNACSNESKNQPEQPNEQIASNSTASKVSEEIAPEKEALAWPNIENSDVFLKNFGEQNKETIVLLKTKLGNIKIRLFEDTPYHRANFLFNVKRELYEKTIFYRVVPNFIIQGGNSDYDKTIEKRAENAAYYIPNETKAGHIHKRGAVAMAMTYENNPKQKSAQYSYYIVVGKKFDDAVLDATEREYSVKLSPNQREAYKTVGGAPHLDGVHTVFGEVIEGMDVVDAISKVETDTGEWPVNDILIEYEVLE